jgi:hypothetical protein
MADLIMTFPRKRYHDLIRVILATLVASINAEESD